MIVEFRERGMDIIHLEDSFRNQTPWSIFVQQCSQAFRQLYILLGKLFLCSGDAVVYSLAHFRDYHPGEESMEKFFLCEQFGVAEYSKYFPLMFSEDVCKAMVYQLREAVLGVISSSE